MVRTATPLQEISPDLIKQNKDNPRLIFKEDEMTQLLESIKEVGIKVPLSVYPDGTKYILIDGERRWRCAKKLNLKAVPAIVQPKPTPLENLLMMFNIHNVRVDWELMPMALKLGQIRDMLIKAGKASTPKSLSAITGVKLPTVRRALDLLGPHRVRSCGLTYPGTSAVLRPWPALSVSSIPVRFTPLENK